MIKCLGTAFLNPSANESRASINHGMTNRRTLVGGCHCGFKVRTKSGTVMIGVFGLLVITMKTFFDAHT